MTSKSNRTLKDMLDIIIYENPSTQQEIADKLGISRRYVTQLMQPLIQEGVVKRSYMIDLETYETLMDRLDTSIDSPQHSGNIFSVEAGSNNTTGLSVLGSHIFALPSLPAVIISAGPILPDVGGTVRRMTGKEGIGYAGKYISGR